MGCLTVSITRATTDAALSFGRVFDTLVAMPRKGVNADACFVRIGGADAGMYPTARASFRMGIVCGVSLDSGVLWASDGRLVTLEGGYLIVN